jgi:hypothetical protein
LQKDAQSRHFPYVADRKLVERFRRLLLRTKAKAVKSSTWRYDPAGLFSARHWGIPFIGVTPDMPDKPRCAEILAWLAEHPRLKRYAVRSRRTAGDFPQAIRRDEFLQRQGQQRRGVS